MAIQPSQGGALERKQETSSLADVVSTILDKGIVIDVFARVSLVGIELLRVDARVVVASVDTYLRFAEAANRLQLGTEEPQQLSDVVGDLTESGSKGVSQGKTKGALEAGADKLGDLFSSGDEEQGSSGDEGQEEEVEAERPRRAQRRGRERQESGS
jgi:gas vesicle structural protein